MNLCGTMILFTLATLIGFGQNLDGKTSRKEPPSDRVRAEDYRLDVAFAGSPMQVADHRPNLPGGGTATTTYDENDRPTEVLIRDAQGAEVSRTVSVYDEQSNITEEKQILTDPLNLIPADARAKILADSGASGADLREQLKKINMMTTTIGRRKLLPILPALALRLKLAIPSGEPSATSEIAGYEPPASEQETCW